jgi:hypothetical protein
MQKQSMYTRHQICRILKPREACFRSRRYSEGEVYDILHEHVPSHRISKDVAIEVLRSLVGSSAGWPATWILHSRLNTRSGGPSTYPGFLSDVSYPEEGVIRFTVSSGNDWAWFEKVICVDAFRVAKE